MNTLEFTYFMAWRHHNSVSGRHNDVTEAALSAVQDDCGQPLLNSIQPNWLFTVFAGNGPVFVFSSSLW